MKVIFITREGFNLPGARVRCYNFARELAKYGIETQVISFADTFGAKDGKEESGLRMGDKLRYNWLAFDKLKAEKDAFLYIQRFNYHSFAPYLAHLFNKNKIILDLDDWEMRENPKYYFGIFPSSKAHYLTKKIAQKSIFCVAASRLLQEFLSQFSKRVYYIPSGVDTDLFRPSGNGRDDKKVIFSWIGTLHKKEYIENIALALDCFCRLRRKYAYIYFEIVGDGTHGNSLSGVMKRCNDPNISIKGWIAPSAAKDYLDTIDIGLFPVARKIKFNLAKSPTKLFEYMAKALPTVSSKIGEADHIIRDGEDGYLAGTKEEFIKKMQILIEDRNLRQRMGQSARRSVEGKYSLNLLGKRLYEILSQNNG